VSTLSSVSCDETEGQQPRLGAAKTWLSLSSVGGHRASVIERAASTPRPPLPQRTASTASADSAPRVPPRRTSSSSIASRVSAFEAIGTDAVFAHRYGRSPPEAADEVATTRHGPAPPPLSMDGTRCTAIATYSAVEAMGQLSLTPGSVVIRHSSEGGWAECTDVSTGERGRVPASAIQAVRETTGAASAAPAAKKGGYTYSSIPSLTGGPKRKISKQPKKR